MQSRRNDNWPPLVTMKLSEGEARAIGTGYRVFVVLLVGRRWAQLFAPATLRRITLPRPAFERFASEARGCRPARVASIIRRNLAVAKRTELARFDRARPVGWRGDRQAGRSGRRQMTVVNIAGRKTQPAAVEAAVLSPDEFDRLKDRLAAMPIDQFKRLKNQLRNAVRHDLELTGSHRHVGEEIADHLNLETRYAWIPQERIARNLGFPLGPYVVASILFGGITRSNG